MHVRPVVSLSAVLLLTLALPLAAPTSVWLAPFAPRVAHAQTLTQDQLAKITPHLEAGEKLMNARNWDAAAKEYDAIIALQPPSMYTLGAYVTRGVVNRSRKQRKAALSDWTAAIDLAPKIPAGTPNKDVTLGMAYRNRGLARAEISNFDAAIDDFDKALKLYPNDVAALVGRGRAKADTFFKGNPDEDFAAALKLDPRSADALAARGDKKRGLGLDEDAAQAALLDYNAALAIDKDNAPALFGRSQARDTLATTDADNAAARADLNRAIELDPLNIHYYVTRAIDETSEKPNGPAKAIADYGRAIELDPDNADRYLDRARLQAGQPQPDNAQLLGDYNKAIDLALTALKTPARDDAFDKALHQSTLAQSLMGRGELYTRQGKLQEAINDFNDAVNLNKTSMRAVAGRGRILIRAGEAQMAISEINAAMPRARKDNLAGPGFAVRGQAFVELEQYADALVDLNAAIKDDSLLGFDVFSQNPELYFNRGRAYNGLDQNDKALADFNIAVKLDPGFAKPLQGTSYEAKLKPVAPDKTVVIDSSNTPAAHKLLGNEWRAAGDPAKALEEYNKALALDANYADAYNNRAGLSKAAGKMDDALADYSKAVALKPGDARFVYNRGILLLSMGKSAEGTQDIQKAIALDPKNSNAIGALGTAQQAAGKFAEAETSYTRQLQLATTEDEKHLGQIRLIIVRATQDKAPAPEELKMVLALETDELRRLERNCAAQMKAAPGVKALEALHQAIADKLKQDDAQQEKDEDDDPLFLI